MAYEFLSTKFIEAMEDIGRHGHQKYGEKSIQHRLAVGDKSRIEGSRYTPVALAEHAAEHFRMHLRGELHDHFSTRRHQLAAVAFNAMMEFMFAGLESECEHNGGFTYEDSGPLSDDICFKICSKDVL